MGPVFHGQPGLPPAKNLENLHQGNKVFDFLADAKGNPTPLYYTVQKAMYESGFPWRHQHDFLVKHFPKVKLPEKKVNAPLYSLWNVNGKSIRLSYIESRQVYCHFYERFASVFSDFAILQEKLAAGVDIVICGYDAYQPTRPLIDHYKDPSAPFGHELVLYTMLTETDPTKYPWRVCQTLKLP